MYRYTRPPKTGPRVEDGIGPASYVGSYVGVLRRSGEALWTHDTRLATAGHGLAVNVLAPTG